jgi:hypothetical protein
MVVQLGGGRVEIPAPVVPERLHVPALCQVDEQFAVVLFQDSRRRHRSARLHVVHAVGREAERAQGPEDDARDPQPQPAAAGAELAAHDPVQDHDVAFLGTLARPGLTLEHHRTQRAVAPGSEVGPQDRLLLGGRRGQDLRELLDVGRLDPLDEGSLIEHGAPPLFPRPQIRRVVTISPAQRLNGQVALYSRGTFATSPDMCAAASSVCWSRGSHFLVRAA